MKITVKDGRYRIFLILPTGLAFSSTMSKIVGKCGFKVPEIPKSARTALKKSVGKIKRLHRCYELVRVESADGSTVVVTL